MPKKKLSSLVKLPKQDTEFLEQWKGKAILTTRSEFDFAAKCLVAGTAIYKKVDEQRKEQKAPFLSGGRDVDARFNGLLKPMDEALKHLRRLVEDFEATERAERAAEAAKQVKGLKDKARAADIVALARTTPQGEAPGLSYVEDLVVTVTDLAAVDPKLVVIDEVKTRKRVKDAWAMGTREFPGMTVEVRHAVRVGAPSE